MTTSTYVPLDNQQHKNVSVSADPSFAHAKAFNLVTIGFNEIAVLCGCMPLVVVKNAAGDVHSLACVVGIEQYGNLFCGENHWQGHAIPLSIQTHPFNYSLNENSVTVLIDESSPLVNQHDVNNTTAQSLLFSSDRQPSSVLKSYQENLANLITGQQQADAFLDVLNRHNLLTNISIKFTFADGVVAESTNLLSINEERLASLPQEVITELHQQGILMAINAMILSLRQYNRIVQLTQTHDNPILKVGLKLVGPE